MTAPQLPLNPTPEPTATSLVPAPTPAGTPAPWTAPANAPEWARGKTADEILAISTQMANSLAVQQPPAPVQRPAPQPNGMPTDDQWISRPNDAAAAIADARVAQALAPALAGMQGLAVQGAMQSRFMAAQQMQDVFGKYGHEVDTLMKDVPLEARTLDNWVKVAKYVRGEHMEEFATERAKQMMANGGLGERSGGVTGVPGTVPNVYDPAKLPAGMGEVAQRHGMTEAMVTEWCKKNGWTTEKWMNEMNNGKVFTSTSPFTMEMRDDQLGIKRQYGE